MSVGRSLWRVLAKAVVSDYSHRKAPRGPFFSHANLVAWPDHVDQIFTTWVLRFPTGSYWVPAHGDELAPPVSHPIDRWNDSPGRKSRAPGMGRSLCVHP